jgi:hypothetical protein
VYVHVEALILCLRFSTPANFNQYSLKVPSSADSSPFDIPPRNPINIKGFVLKL